MSPQDAPVTTQRNGVTLISLTDAHSSLDTAHAKHMADSLLQFAECVDPPLVVIDLSETTTFGSVFLASLVRMWKTLESRDGRFAMAGLNPHCQEIIETTHLHQIWEIFKTADDAIRELA